MIRLLVLIFSISISVQLMAATEPATNKAAQTELTESNIEIALAEHDQSKKAKEVDSTVLQTQKQSEQKESEIPVVLETKKGDLGTGSALVKMLLGVLLICGACFASWIAIRKYKLKNRATNPATQLKIIAQHHLGPKKSLAIIRVAGESILVGITDHHISLIKPLSLLDEEIPEEVPQNFNSIFSGQNNKSEDREVERDQEDFSFAGIRDVVSAKIKGMRSFQ